MAVALNQTDVFGAVSAPARREMIAMLARREMPVTELASAFDMTLSAVSQHLSVLKSAGLVAMRKDGRQRLYRLDPPPLRDLADWVAFYEQFWSDKLSDLGKHLEQNP